MTAPFKKGDIVVYKDTDPYEREMEVYGCIKAGTIKYLRETYPGQANEYIITYKKRYNNGWDWANSVKKLTKLERALK